MDINIIEQSMKEVTTEMEKEELYHIVLEIEKILPTIIVEIGIKYGGTLNIWKNIIPSDGTLIGIDRLNLLKLDVGQDNRIKFIHGDSLNYKTYQDFIYILRDRKIDCLFIDGGHKYGETKSDFYTYGWHVRKGGMIVFHDIYLNSEGEIVGSTKHFWDEIKKKSGIYWEIITEIPLHTGTGIIKIL